VVVGFSSGDFVRVRRDESRFPARGSWKSYRGRVGVVESVERSGEVAVRLGAQVSWFRPDELVRASAMEFSAEGRLRV
jgi:hypothetical protein